MPFSVTNLGVKLEDFFGLQAVLDEMFPEESGRAIDPVVPVGRSVEPTEPVSLEPDGIVDYKQETSDCYRVTLQRVIPEGTEHHWRDVIGAQVNSDGDRSFVYYTAYLSERELNEALEY